MVHKCFDKKSSGGAVPCARSVTLATKDKSALKMKLYYSVLHPFNPTLANLSPSYMVCTRNQNISRLPPIP